MDVMGEALKIGSEALLRFGTQEAELSGRAAGAIIDRIRNVASTLTTMARSMFPDQITQDTVHFTQGRIDDNVDRLRQTHGQASRPHARSATHRPRQESNTDGVAPSS
jgi:serine/threonine-protein kinase HipA